MAVSSFFIGKYAVTQAQWYAGSHPYGAAEGYDRQKTVPVGSLGIANAFGLYEMHGNV